MSDAGASGALGQTATLAFAVAVLMIVILVALLIGGLRGVDRPEDSDDSDSGGGGGGLHRRGPPNPPHGGGEPAWWPEFEREFAEHLTRELRVPNRADLLAR